MSGMDEAWARCERAMPLSGRVHLQRRAESLPIEWKDQTWIARQGRTGGVYEAWATDVVTMKAAGFAYGDTPVEALTALATILERVVVAPAHA